MSEATQVAPTTPTPTAAAPTPAPAEAKPPEKPAEVKSEDIAAELKAAKAEALKAARELRETKAKLAEIDRREKEQAATRAQREAELKELEALKAKNPREWLQRAAGEDPAAFAKRIAAGQETAEARLQRELAELREQLKASEQKQAEAAKAAEERAREEQAATAYRFVMDAASADPELALAVEELREDPARARKWISGWVDRDWPTYASENGLDVTDPRECAKAVAKVIDKRALARLEKLRQNPHIAKRIGFAVQSSEPPASPGAQPPRTITSDVAGSRSAAPASTAGGERPLTDAELRKRAILKAHELAAKANGGATR